MKLKITTNYWLSVALALVALLLGVSALLLWVIFPLAGFCKTSNALRSSKD